MRNDIELGLVRNVVTIFGLYTLAQDEVGVKLTFGKYSGSITPGFNFAIPGVQSVRKTKSSLMTLDLPDQQIVLNGNISVQISGSLNFRVVNPRKAILEVQNYAYSVRQLALTTISDVLGTKSIEDVRGNKGQVAKEIENIVSEMAQRWGIADVDIRLTDARFDEKLLMAMMRETEAEKEAAAIRIKANADVEVAESFVKAAKKLANVPGAMTLRVLQTLNDISNTKSTVVVPIPVDFMTTLKSFAPQILKDPAGPGPISLDAVDTESYPEAPVFKEDGKQKSNCPHCGAKYNVSDILGLVGVDRDPNVPGQQVKCKLCKTVFTLKP
jgi:regulator of protease activity HflC (stomatin/prohibitin superfamily)